MAVVPRVPRRHRRQATRHRPRRPGAPRRHAPPRHGRARRQPRAGHARRHRGDGRPRPPGHRGRRPRVHDQPHAQPPLQQGRADPVAERRGGRALRHRRSPRRDRQGRAPGRVRLQGRRPGVRPVPGDGPALGPADLDLGRPGPAAPRAVALPPRPHDRRPQRRHHDPRPVRGARRRPAARLRGDAEPVHARPAVEVRPARPPDARAGRPPASRRGAPDPARAGRCRRQEPRRRRWPDDQPLRPHVPARRPAELRARPARLDRRGGRARGALAGRGGLRRDARSRTPRRCSTCRR